MDEGLSPLTKWQMEHEQKLAEQAKRAAEEQEKVRATARAEIEKFKGERASKAEKARQNNKEAEKHFSSEHREKEEGNPWEQIVQLIDLKAGKTEGKDVSAMRRILLEAKHLPVKSH